jgi:hypothetical protein
MKIEKNLSELFLHQDIRQKDEKNGSQIFC